MSKNVENTLKYIGSSFNEGVTPEVERGFKITDYLETLVPQDVSKFVRIASLIPDYIRFSAGIVQMVMQNTKDSRKAELFRRIRLSLGLERVFGNVVSGQAEPPSCYTSDPKLEPKRHVLTRVDLVRTEDNRFRIVEFEVGKTHGLGFATLCRNLVAINDEQSLGVGLVRYFEEVLAQESVVQVLSSTEVTYEREQRYFARQLNGRMVVFSQDAFEPNNFGGRVIISRPAFQTMNRGKISDGAEKQHRLDLLIKQGDIRCLNFGIPGLSNKVFMGLLSNRERDKGLSCINEEMTERGLDVCGLRKHIPQTESLGVSKRYFGALQRYRTGSYFLKKGDDSGARGIMEPAADDRNVLKLFDQREKLILQREVASSVIDINAYSMDGEKSQGSFTRRYSMFVGSRGELLDLTVTASPGKIAHGSSDSVMYAPIVK